MNSEIWFNLLIYFTIHKVLRHAKDGDESVNQHDGLLRPAQLMVARSSRHDFQTYGYPAIRSQVRRSTVPTLRHDNSNYLKDQQARKHK